MPLMAEVLIDKENSFQRYLRNCGWELAGDTSSFIRGWTPGTKDSGDIYPELSPVSLNHDEGFGHYHNVNMYYRSGKDKSVLKQR